LGITPISLCASGVQHIVGKLSTRAITLFIPHLNPRFARKIWAPKVVGIPTMGISKLPFGSLGTK